MAYDKQTWVSGEVITATKLNHMEDGIANSGGGNFIITVTTTYTQDDENGWLASFDFDKTPAEAIAAYNAGQTLKIHSIDIYVGDDTYDNGYSNVVGMGEYVRSQNAFFAMRVSYNGHDSVTNVTWVKLIWTDESAFDSVATGN